MPRLPSFCHLLRVFGTADADAGMRPRARLRLCEATERAGPLSNPFHLVFLIVTISSPRSKSLTILTGCLTHRLPECSCEIRLAGKAQRQRNIRQRPIAMDQQSFRTFEAPGTDVAMRRLPHGLLEGPREMIFAQTRNRRDPVEREIALQIFFYVIQHAQESTTIESFPCGTGKKLRG